MIYANFFIAIRHLLAKKTQTLIAVLGVTFGIAMFIFMSGIVEGVNEVLETSQLSTTPHIRLYNEIAPSDISVVQAEFPKTQMLVKLHHQRPKNEKLNLRNLSQLLKSLKLNPEIEGISPQVNTPVMYHYGATLLNGNIQGVNIIEEDKLFKLGRKIKSGKMERLLQVSNGIIMGAGLAKKLEVKTDDNIVITTPNGQLFALKVIGIFKTGMGQIDNVRSYANIGMVQKLLQQNPSFITDIHIKLKDRTKAKLLAPYMGKNYGCKAEDWETANAVILQSNTIREIMKFVVCGALLVVAGFGIYNIMNMTINNKMKDIAILKATGFAGSDVMTIFLFQSIIVGFIGALLGLAMGYAFSYLVSRAPFNGGDFLDIDHFPVSFNPQYYFFGIGFGILTTILAGLIPSRKAAKIDPVSILRG